MPGQLRNIVLALSPFRRAQAGIFRGVRHLLHGRQSWRVHHMEVNEGFPQLLADMECDGIIASVADVRLVERDDVPRVFIGTPHNREGVHTVEVDDLLVGRQAAEHLMEKGCRRFAFADAGLSLICSEQRGRGFAERLSEEGFTCSTLALSTLPVGGILSSSDKRRQGIVGFLRSIPHPVGVFASSDNEAAEVADCCERFDISIPEDVTLLGVNDSPMCEMVYPPLSSVPLPSEMIGYEAASVLDQLLHGQKPFRLRTFVPPPPTICRRSTDVLLVDDPDVAAALRYIRKHAGEPLEINDIVDAIVVGRRSLERRFRQQIGRSPREELHRVRMQLARELLSASVLPVSEIARRCGFSGADQFGAAFRRETGTSPRDYRLLHRPAPRYGEISQ